MDLHSYQWISAGWVLYVVAQDTLLLPFSQIVFKISYFHSWDKQSTSKYCTALVYVVRQERIHVIQLFISGDLLCFTLDTGHGSLVPGWPGNHNRHTISPFQKEFSFPLFIWKILHFIKYLHDQKILIYIYIYIHIYISLYIYININLVRKKPTKTILISLLSRSKKKQKLVVYFVFNLLCCNLTK